MTLKADNPWSEAIHRLLHAYSCQGHAKQASELKISDNMRMRRG